MRKTQTPFPSPSPRHPVSRRRSRRSRRPQYRGCCCSLWALVGILALVVGAYLLFPSRTNIAILGMDYADPGSYVARTDTIMLMTVIPLDPYIALVSIPRDLWVNIPEVGENRINTAHFFAEASQPGTGPQATLQTIEANFGIEMDYYIRLRFESFREIVYALGSVEITLTKHMAGYAPGTYELKGRKALAFVRSREGADDFARMQQGQLMVKSIIKTALKPQNWFKIPNLLHVLFTQVDTDLPSWQWPRIAFALMRAGYEGIETYTISREMTTSFITNEGAQVLLPKWDLIQPFIRSILIEYK